MADRYFIGDDDRRLPSGGPLKSEYYGSAWYLHQAGADPGRHDPVVIVPDPGDGSAEPLARKILGLLNADGSPAS